MKEGSFKKIVTLVLILINFALLGQEKVGDKWYDNGLELAVSTDEIKTNGVFTFCIQDTATGFCVENLTTGVEVEVYNNSHQIVWKGIASGRTSTLKLPRKMPDARYLIVKAFRPFVINTLTATRIHQKKRLELKYQIK